MVGVSIHTTWAKLNSLYHCRPRGLRKTQYSLECWPSFLPDILSPKKRLNMSNWRPVRCIELPWRQYGLSSSRWTVIDVILRPGLRSRCYLWPWSHTPNARNVLKKKSIESSGPRDYQSSKIKIHCRTPLLSFMRFWGKTLKWLTALYSLFWRWHPVIPLGIQTFVSCHGDAQPSR